MIRQDEHNDSDFWPLESGLMPLADRSLSPPGKRSGQGLASILPFLKKALRGKPRELTAPPPAPAESTERSPSKSG